ncbi:MAG TPA: hypothetical protein PKX92_07875 [Edaphocola sp.]|nr:hypothetical protein [Edaphocola sp.]
MQPRKLLPMLLMLALFMATFKNGIYSAYYTLNQKSFIETLCENKNKRELNCKGQCQLKHISDDLKQKKEQTKNLNSQQEIVLFFETTFKKTTILILKNSNIQPKTIIPESHYDFLLYLNKDKPPTIQS